MLDDSGIKLLTKCAEAYERSEQARELLAKEGLTYLDSKSSPRAHPACAIERDSRETSTSATRLPVTVDHPPYDRTGVEAMPRKRRVNKAKEQLTDSQWKYLSDQPLPANFEKFVLDIDFHGNMEQLWNQNCDVILAEHVKENPGTRPALWWRYDAPRLPIGTFPGCHYDGKLPQTRERTGGNGTPAHEVQAVLPAFAYGIPTVWVGLDENYPPAFESQAAYLKRHGLLMTGEERRADFEPEEAG
jgi:hypothetical protein